ncbi:MAG TPA: flavodoxin domain-containing protein, partial [Gemmatimonadales bacterium]|nr:flavodoxin domain-containing protein [Gemmatimonadales bacterium]
MSSILIVYGTAHGHTTRIVDRIAGELKRRGFQVTRWRGDELPAHVDPEDFDAFVIAGSVLLGRHQRYLRTFVRRHRNRLNQVPSAFVSVSGALMGDWEPGQEKARKYLERFLDRTGWHPSLARSFAGNLAYTRYGPVTRWVMKRISAHTGRPTHTRRDWEFTDWDAVDRLAAYFAARLPAPAVTVA